jgi:hypothetical protein
MKFRLKATSTKRTPLSTRRRASRQRLAEFAAVGVPQIGGFAVEIEDRGETGAGECFAADSGADVVFNVAITTVAAAIVIAHGVQQSLAAFKAGRCHIGRTSQSRWAAGSVDEIQIVVASSKKTGPCAWHWDSP